MSSDVWLVVSAIVLVVLAGLLASMDAAISTFSKARADELVAEGRSGAARIAKIVRDPAPYINTALFLRILAETGAVVMVAVVFVHALDGQWEQVVVATLVMAVVSFVAIGVGPRTLGRQNSERVALLSAAPLAAITRILGPVPRLLIMVGNALTPGKGFREGPFSSEAELRELVDLAEQSALIESDERQMIHSVFELGDTVVREVMVPRTDVVFIERTKTLRQAMSLALRSGYSRIPVTGESLDDVVGMAYLKDITKRVFDNRDAETTERVESVMRPCSYVPDSKPAADLLRGMQSERTHVAIVVDEYGGTAGMVTIEDILEEIVGEITDEYDAPPEDVEHLSNGSVRISARYDVDDLQHLFGVPIEDDDVDSVGGLMAKHLGKVPIAGSEVLLDGLRFVAEAPRGRRNRIGTVLVSREETEDDSAESVGAAASG
ncbi:hemolysin family protein [Mumia sp. zg.B53]|uniref:hemolysin family protein n=1 Tax=unclassified Mumia TaxID=2621872 RepID=UPI001C6E2112|nr:MULTISPECIES: hemolysin family protein [unclassified Mumia]MBW9206434.1 hemolysin family protein [Mumia sp. zg.B17]MBW9211276.1 hemolysin family protein [Mumia sp. zg.B21]MBW9215851.1 hemolysin family protein [Mumia sp. zg.B53]MDD9349792.1 hemolysin family protein [Mumia sp.]